MLFASLPCPISDSNETGMLKSVLLLDIDWHNNKRINNLGLNSMQVFFPPVKNRLNYKLHHLVLPKIYFIIFVQFSTLTFNFCSNLVIPLESVRIARLTFNFVQYKTLKLHCFGGSFMAKFWQINGGRAELNKVERWMHESEVLTKRYSNVNRKINHHSY